MSAGLIATERRRRDAGRDLGRAEAVRSRTSWPASRRAAPCRGASPCTLLVPDLVTMFIAGPAVQPNSAENALVKHREFLDGADRHRCEHRLAAPAFVVVGAVEHERRGAAAAAAGDEIGRVDEQIAGALALAERRVEQRQAWSPCGRESASRRSSPVSSRRADLRVGAHALSRAVHRHFSFAAARHQLHAAR